VADVTGWEPTVSPAYDNGASIEAVESIRRDFYTAQYPHPGGSRSQA
jgi:hypothetical protein